MTFKKAIYALISLLLSSCAVTWQEAVSYGEVSLQPLHDSVETELKLGLVIVPVQIGGETYRFLFDTGAPFSVSEQLQDKYGFDRVTKGRIIDSDENRSTVDYVSIKELMIGQTIFKNQTAFVADFQANPKLKCLALDGIIGSNLMRHCNWTISIDNKEIIISDTIVAPATAMVVPFKTNAQYDIFVDLKVANSYVKNVKLDYGSNTYLSLRSSDYDKCYQEGALDTFLLNSGSGASGIIGESISYEEKMSPIDTLRLGDVVFSNMIVERTFSNLLGTSALSYYQITIDWYEKQLLFNRKEREQVEYEAYGFGLGYSEDNGFYVESLVQHSPVYNQGLELGMKVLAVNDLDFSVHNYCDYIDLMNKKSDSLSITVLNAEGIKDTYVIKRSSLF